jgi:hypothetical protein
VQQVAGHGLDIADVALTKVSPSQATPRTQTQALMPDLKVLALSTSPVSILQVMLISVAIVSINTTIASLRGRTGFWISPTVSLMAVA